MITNYVDCWILQLTYYNILDETKNYTRSLETWFSWYSAKGGFEYKAYYVGQLCVKQFGSIILTSEENTPTQKWNRPYK